MVLAVNFVGNVLPHLPGFELLRDVGLAMHVTLVLWATACLTALLGRERTDGLRRMEGNKGLPEAA